MTKSITPNKLKEFYQTAYAGELWSLPNLRPSAISTTAYDDIARLLNCEYLGTKKMLDVGCGAGKLVMALAKWFDFSVGFDLSETHIFLAKKMLREHLPKMEEKIDFLVGDANGYLPFHDGEFDAVLLCAVLEHVVDVFSLMDELARICKKGGMIVLSVPNICYVRHIFDLLRGRLPLTGVQTREINEWRNLGWDGGHLHYFTKSSLDGLLRNAGFFPDSWTGDGRFAKIRRWRTNWVGSLTVRARRR